MTLYLWLYLIVDKKVKQLLTARIYYKENYLKPNSDPSRSQTPVCFNSFFKDQKNIGHLKKLL